MKHQLLIRIHVMCLVLFFAFDVSANSKCQDLFLLKYNEVEVKNESIVLPTLEQVEKSKNLSQLARSNAYHFWRWAKIMVNNLPSFGKNKTELIKGMTSFEGIVMGDAHLGNIHKVFDYVKGKLKWKNIDLDDAGRGSYFFDFLHLVLTVKVVGANNIKTEDMIKAYHAGLNGNDMKVPDSIKEFTGLSLKKFEKKRKEYVEKKTTEDGKFKLSSELIEFDAALIKAKGREEVESILKEHLGGSIKVLDLALVVQERGGGSVRNVQTPLGEEVVSNKRIWALLEIEGQRHIYEIKEKGESGLNGYQKQESIVENFNHSRDFFGYSEKELFLVQIGETIYYVREKKITLFDVPYDQKNNKEVQFLHDLGFWGAYQLGLLHRGNANGVEYAEFIKENKKAFSDLIKDFRKEYQDILENALEEKEKNKKD